MTGILSTSKWTKIIDDRIAKTGIAEINFLDLLNLVVKVYLSPVIDWLDGMPIAWTVGTHPDEQLVNEMLLKAMAQLKPGQHPIIHPDRGVHYRWTKWIALTESSGLQRSMLKKACSADNSACEGFFDRMKVEMLYGRSWGR